MYSAINSAIPSPRFFSPTPRMPRLTAPDFTTPRAEIPQTQNTLSSHEKTPIPAREFLMAAALAYQAYQGPIMAKMFIEEDKKRESAETSSPNFTMAA